MDMIIKAKDLRVGDIIAGDGYGQNIEVLELRLNKADNRITYNSTVKIIYDYEKNQSFMILIKN